MAPVARAPQDPHPPTTCLCLDRKVKAGKVGYRDCTRRKQEGRKTRSGGGSTLGRLKLELGNSAA